MVLFDHTGGSRTDDELRFEIDATLVLACDLAFIGHTSYRKLKCACKDISMFVD